MARTQTGNRKHAPAPPPPQDNDAETREQKFKRLAEARVTRALNSGRLVGNLGSPNYQASDEYKQRIVDAMQGMVDEVKQKLFRPKGKQSLKFSWGEKEMTH